MESIHQITLPNAYSIHGVTDVAATTGLINIIVAIMKHIVPTQLLILTRENNYTFLFNEEII